MGIIDNAKEIAELVKKYNDQDLYRRIVELRTEILDLKEENLSLRERVKEFEQTAAISGELLRDGNAYYRQLAGGERLGPYCMSCWDYDRKLVNLKVHSSRIDGRNYTSYSCSICTARKK